MPIAAAGCCLLLLPHSMSRMRANSGLAAGLPSSTAGLSAAAVEAEGAACFAASAAAGAFGLLEGSGSAVAATSTLLLALAGFAISPRAAPAAGTTGSASGAGTGAQTAAAASLLLLLLTLLAAAVPVAAARASASSRSSSAIWLRTRLPPSARPAERLSRLRLRSSSSSSCSMHSLQAWAAAGAAHAVGRRALGETPALAMRAGFCAHGTNVKCQPQFGRCAACLASRAPLTAGCPCQSPTGGAVSGTAAEPWRHLLPAALRRPMRGQAAARPRLPQLPRCCAQRRRRSSPPWQRGRTARCRRSSPARRSCQTPPCWASCRQRCCARLRRARGPPPPQ